MFFQVNLVEKIYFSTLSGRSIALKSEKIVLQYVITTISTAVCVYISYINHVTAIIC